MTIIKYLEVYNVAVAVKNSDVNSIQRQSNDTSTAPSKTVVSNKRNGLFEHVSFQVTAR
jgi:hypothetical protein